jgi:hypothetical protein
MIQSIDQLKKLYETTLKFRLILIEKERKKILWFYGASLLLLVIIFYKIKQTEDATTISATDMNWMFLVGAFLTILLISAIRLHMKLKKNFKHKIVQEVINIINPKWHYDHENHLNENRIIVSNIFNQSDVDRISGDDYIEGEWNNIPFKMSELKIQKRVQTKKKTRYQTIFNGLFIEIDFPKRIEAETYIYSDATEAIIGKWLGDFFQSLNFGRGELIKLENPDFEKMFRVHSECQIKSRVLVTPLFMENLIKLRKKLNKNIHMAFHGTSLYVAVQFDDSILEPKLFGAMDTFSVVRETYLHLTTVCSIIEHL